VRGHPFQARAKTLDPRKIRLGYPDALCCYISVSDTTFLIKIIVIIIVITYDAAAAAAVEALASICVTAALHTSYSDRVLGNVLPMTMALSSIL